MTWSMLQIWWPDFRVKESGMGDVAGSGPEGVGVDGREKEVTSSIRMALEGRSVLGKSKVPFR